ncbi:MAG: DUF4399 domain-containing protein [Bacteroidota bacterium]|nr:DUF4399 domain-containing protein [Bacteroidota bacterium]
MTRSLFPILAIALLFTACAEPVEEAAAPAEEVVDLRSPAPEGARVFFANLEDGATVSSPFTVEFGLEGMDVIPAGTDQEHSGHHHLMIDLDELPAMDMPMPADSQHVHFGKGQTSVELDLAPGDHRLQLVLGNYLHIPHDPPVISEVITVTVE